MENQNISEPEQIPPEESLEPAAIMNQFVKIYSQYVQKCNDLEKYQTELERVQEKLTRKETALTEQTSQNENLKIRLEMLNAQNQRLEKKVQETLDRYESMMEKMTGFTEIYRQTEQNMQYYEKQNAELERKLKETEPSPVLEQKVKNLQKKLEESEETIFQYQQDAEALQAKNKQLQTQISQLREELTLKSAGQPKQETSPQPVSDLNAFLSAAASSGNLQIEQPASRSRKSSDFDIDVSIIDVPIDNTPKSASDDEVIRRLFGIT